MAYKDKERKKVYAKEKRNLDGEPLSHSKLRQSMKEQSKILKAYIKATTEKPREQEEQEVEEQEVQELQEMQEV